jgi:hypothetical protein
MTSMTLYELLKQIYTEDTAFERAAGIIEKRLTAPEEKSDPMYIKALVAVAAWFSAGFMIASLRIADFLEDGFSAALIGLIFIVAAIVLSIQAKSKRNTFIEQLSLALAIAGNVLVMFGIGDIAGHKRELPVLLLIQIIICCIVYPAFKNAIYRYISPIAASVLAVAWIVDERMPGMLFLIIAIEMLIFGVLALKKSIPDVFEPLMYSAATMLPVTVLFMNFSNAGLSDFRFYISEWPSSIILSLGIIYLIIELAGGVKRIREPWLLVAILSAIALGTITTPGVLIAIGLMIIGYAHGDRLLLGLSFVFLPCFLFFFYYSLNIDLAYKSYVLAGSGAVLIIIRQVIHIIIPAEDRS